MRRREEGKGGAEAGRIKKKLPFKNFSVGVISKTSDTQFHHFLPSPPTWTRVLIFHCGSLLSLPHFAPTGEGQQKEVFLNIFNSRLVLWSGGIWILHEFLELGFSWGALILFHLEKLNSGVNVEWRGVGISCVSFCASLILHSSGSRLKTSRVSCCCSACCSCHGDQCSAPLHYH